MENKQIVEAVNYLINNDRLNKYHGLDNMKTPKVEYLKKIVQFDDKLLFSECKNMIWLSAYANNNPRSDYHWQCDACYDEGKRRNKPEIYKKAYKEVSKQ